MAVARRTRVFVCRPAACWLRCMPGRDAHPRRRLDDRRPGLQRRAGLRRCRRDNAPRPGDGAELDGRRRDGASRRPRRSPGRDYVVLVADVYGRACARRTPKRPAPGERAEWRPPELRARMQKAVEVLKAQAGKAPLDARQSARSASASAARRCWNWRAAARARRRGEPAMAGWIPRSPAAGAVTRTPVLVLNGADDKGVSRDDIARLRGGNERRRVPTGSSSISAARCTASRKPTRAATPTATAATTTDSAAKRAYRMMRRLLRANGSPHPTRVLSP